jgi:hypothetical protein
MAETRVRIPVAVLTKPPLGEALFSPLGQSEKEQYGTRGGPVSAQACGSRKGSAACRQSANTRTSTGLAAAEPSIVPEHDTGCSIQRGSIRLTQCPLATLARPDAPPLSLDPELTQCTDHLKLSGSLLGSVTTSRNDLGARTCEKGVANGAVGVALSRTSKRPYVSAATGLAEQSVAPAARAAIAGSSPCRFDDICRG